MKLLKTCLHWVKLTVITCLHYIRLTTMLFLTSAIIGYTCWYFYDKHLTEIKQYSYECGKVDDRLSEIYSKIKSVTEVSNRIPKICTWTETDSIFSINAFTTGHGIYISYASAIGLSTEELALIIGHEIAHGILHHTDNEYQTFVKNYSNEDELIADNLGAFWANKAGYDVCAGRELFKKFGGNSLNGSHPPNIYRYENLKHYCKEK